MEKSVGIIGASGLLGGKLAQAYESRQWRVIRFSRQSREVEGQTWKMLSAETLMDLDVLVNLAGERIDKRWTSKNKKTFRESRVGLTERVAQLIAAMEPESRPKVWLNASAVGVYGACGDTLLSEEQIPGVGFLSNLCEEWEAAAHVCDIKPCRVIHPRIGIVLGEEAAAWRKMKGLFNLGLGGKLGSGEQWFPWVHIDDVAGAFAYLADNELASGAYNIVAPNPVRNVEFTRALGDELGRPTLLPVPRFGLNLVLGEFAGALLASQRVSSVKLSKIGYKWRYSELKSALSALNGG